MSGKQSTLMEFDNHPNSSPVKEHEEDEPEIKKTDPINNNHDQDQDPKVELQPQVPSKDDLPHSQILDQIGKNKIRGYDKEYLVDISEEELKNNILEYIEKNKPVYFDEIMDKFSNTRDPIILRVLSTLHEENNLHGYRKNGESLLTIKEPRKDGTGNIVKNEWEKNPSYLEEPEPDRKPETTRDKSPTEISLSRDEEKLISIIRGLHRKLAKKDRSWITYKEVYDNRPENWITLRMDRTLTELIKYGVLEVEGVASKEYRLNIKRLKDIQAMNSEGNS